MKRSLWILPHKQKRREINAEIRGQIFMYYEYQWRCRCQTEGLDTDTDFQAHTCSNRWNAQSLLATQGSHTCMPHHGLKQNTSLIQQFSRMSSVQWMAFFFPPSQPGLLKGSVFCWRYFPWTVLLLSLFSSSSSNYSPPSHSRLKPPQPPLQIFPIILLV